jgi:hypothetical protein
VLVLAAVYQLRGTPYFPSYAWALAASWFPFALAAAGAAGGIVLARRRVADGPA